MTGWRIVHHETTASTNDDVAALRDQGARERVAVVADEQGQGRGREGRTFASPRGGLYVSLLLPVAPASVPHAVVAFAALSVCEAIEANAPVTCGIKWPNDIWIEGRKVAGILLEAAGAERPVVIGIGVNVAATPETLPASVRAQTTSLADEAGMPPTRDALLVSLLQGIDSHATRLADPGMSAAWRRRLLWIGQPVALSYVGAPRSGVLEDVDLVRGLLVRDALAGPVWLDAAHVQDLRRA